MFLITSAAFVDDEIQSEFGKLPPSFLPVGNKRLLYHQLEIITGNDKVIVTLPESFKLGRYDKKILSEKNVEILYLPEHLTLGESIVYALNLIEFSHDEELYILHGDTLFDSIPSKPDIIGLSKVEENYNWAEYNLESGELSQYRPDNPPSSELISNGFFSFSSPKTLIRHITRQKWDFISGINEYHKERGLTPHIFKTWFDFGHIHTYYTSKTRMTTQREFNNMVITGQVVTKSSHKKFKLKAEANWYNNLPGVLRIYTPALLNINDTEDAYAYSIEYLHLTALNELYVFSQLPAFSWKRILKACCNFLKETSKHIISESYTLETIFKKKTRERLHEFSSTNLVNLELPIVFNGEKKPSIYDIAEISSMYLPKDSGIINVLHGDFCLSNILYDFRTCNIKVIDPRGIDADNKECMLGNTVYDIAKLAHSIIGLYDMIIAGYFLGQIEENNLEFKIPIDSRRNMIIKDFIKLIKDQFNVSEIELYAMQIQLFLSMLPLHCDSPSRQVGFIGNAYRLYTKMIECMEQNK